MSCALSTGLGERNPYHTLVSQPRVLARIASSCDTRRGCRREEYGATGKCCGCGESLIGLETCVPVSARRGARVAWPRVWSALVGDSRGSCDARTTDPVSLASQVRTAPNVHHSWLSRARTRIRATS